jgi:hypothetical protein
MFLTSRRHTILDFGFSILDFGLKKEEARKIPNLRFLFSKKNSALPRLII